MKYFKRKKRFVIGITIAIIILVIGIPIAINECYQRDKGYITIWGAAEVFSYYGTILGTFVSAATIALTIVFTRKQIERESYVQNEGKKWSNIEGIFVRALDSINPMRPLIETMDTGMLNPNISISIFQKYQLACHMAMDQLNAYLNQLDYPKVKLLIDGINDATTEFLKISDKEIKCYAKVRDFSNRSTAIETLKMAAMYPGTFSEDALAFNREILNKTAGVTIEMLNENIIAVNQEMTSAYNAKYRQLLQLKGQTFDIINTEMWKQADCILSFSRFL